MRCLLALAVVGALAPIAVADDAYVDHGSISLSSNFNFGSFKVADVHYLAAPGGQFDLGFRVRRWRLAAELATGNLTQPSDDLEPHASGSFTRAGVAVRWAFKDLFVQGTDNRPSVSFRGFVEAGLGRQHVQTDTLDFGRNDIMLGLGTAPEIHAGRWLLFGATFGARMLISRAPSTSIARTTTTSSPDRPIDIALLFVFGFTFGH
jgi:hypothetical protein